MTNEEKILLAMEKGYTCDLHNGIMFGARGKELKTKDSYGYVRFQIQKEKKKYKIMAHQFIFYKAFGYVPKCIDHIDRDRSNNKIENLRSTTQKINTWNKNAKGCTFHKRDKKWQVAIVHNGKKENLGHYNTKEEAMEVYSNAKKIYHKDAFENLSNK